MAVGQALLSASQFSTWFSCKRKWAFQYLLKIQVPEGKALSTGLRTHKELEEWLKASTPPGPILEPGLVHFPEPNAPELRVESYFSWRGWRGFKDAEVPGRVFDLKTCRTFSYKLTKKQLSNNIQGIVYAAEHMDRYGTDEVELHWVYCRTEGEPEAKLVKISLTREDANAKFKIIQEHAEELIRTREECPEDEIEAYVLSLEPNPRTCSAYGGCPFQSRCNLSPSDRFVLGPSEELFP